MKHSDLKELQDTINRERLELMVGKSHDYAGEDALSNFKRMSDLCAILQICPEESAEDCALFLAVLKLDRYCNLRAEGKTPDNEGVVDTIMDLHNYIDLAYACSIDEEVEPSLGFRDVVYGFRDIPLGFPNDI